MGRLNYGRGIATVVFLLLVIVATTWITEADAAPTFSSFWSSSTSNDDEGNGESDEQKEDEPKDLIVSPIVNRELQASVVAHSWPSSYHTVFCEAWAFAQKSQLLWTYMDTFVTQLEPATTMTEWSYERAIRFAVDAATASLSSTSLLLDPQVLRFALVMRAHSPTCELQRGLAEETLVQLSRQRQQSAIQVQDALAVVYQPLGKIVTTLEELLELFASSHGDDEQMDDDTCNNPRINATDDAQKKNLMEDLLLPNEVPRATTTTDTNATTTLVILYANMASSNFVKWYQQLVSLNVPFVVRHFGRFQDEDIVTPTILQGYGVRLDIRNVEYKVFDDRGSTMDHTAKASLVNVSSLEKMIPEFLAGVNLVTALENVTLSEEEGEEEESTTTLNQDFLQLQKDLWKVHEAQQSRSQIVPPRWQRRQLSLQAAMAVVGLSETSYGSKSLVDPLVTLQDISQNLPSVASTLVNIKVNQELTDMVETMEDPIKAILRQSGAGGMEGGLWINGKSIAIQQPSFNVFQLIQLFQTEQYAHMGQLHSAMSSILPQNDQDNTETDESMISQNALLDIQRAWTFGEGFFNGDMFQSSSDNVDGSDKGDDTKAAYRIDVGRGWKQAVLYLNDVEKDPQYSQWPRSVRQLLISMQYGMPPTVRRNVFTILDVVDPLAGGATGDSEGGTDASIGRSLASQLLQSQFPVRLGVLTVSQSDIDACKEWIAQSSVNQESSTCPVSTHVFGTAVSTPISSQTLKDIPATTQLVHRLLAYMAKSDMIKRQKAMLVHYEEFMNQYVRANMDKFRKNQQKMSAHDVLEYHGNVLQTLRLASRSPSPGQVAADLLEMEEDEMEDGDASDALSLYAKSVRFAVDKGLTPGMSFLNGRPLPTIESSSSESSDGSSADDVGEIFMEEQQLIAQMIMNQEITDSAPRSIYGKILTGSRVFPRVHPLLTDSLSSDKISYFSPKIIHGFGVDSLLVTNSNQKEDGSPAEWPVEKAEAVFVVEAYLELDTTEGLQIARKLIDIMRSFVAGSAKVGEGQANIGSGDSSDSSLAIAYRIIPRTEAAAKSALCPIFASAGVVGASKVISILDQAVQEPTSTLDASVLDKSLQEKISAPREEGPCGDISYLQTDNMFSTSAKNVIVANGRTYVIPQGSPLADVDLELLISLETGRAKAVSKLLKPHITPSTTVSSRSILKQYDGFARTAAFLSASCADDSKRMDPEMNLRAMEKNLAIDDNPFRFSWNDNDPSLKIRVTAIVDPVTETAQRLSPLLRVIRDELKLPLTLVLAPKVILDGDAKIPITSYYRFVANPSAFQDGTSTSSTPMAHFSNLPTDHTLTLRMDVPEPWDVQQTYSVQDTDNLRCDLKAGCSDDDYFGSSVSKSTDALEKRHLTRVEYGLNSLLVSGQCYQVRGSPPNGLQLTLSKNSDLKLVMPSVTAEQDVVVEADGSTFLKAKDDNSLSEDIGTSDGHYSDTLVMKNVGYWQLRGQPGVWKLQIAKNSRGAEIFDMVSGSYNRGIIVRSSKETNNSTKRIVMGDFVSSRELLLVQRRPGFQKASLFSDKVVDETDNDVINVFSLATGHLYERFLKIMMLSVTKRTSSKVKFWLFENFLSPTFKSSARAMAEQIGCEIEFVTYKWPEWLRGQSEKQRIIWGYKILFLDVLFPLSVKKIIYVDADQVVRGDLKELWDMDLQGAPYGYTPFCTSRESTLGFQFWNSGFWASHLQGKPYHISALYVVDLERFRRNLVGDQLRSIYQGLSADPNSLANLDQDLPNYAQHQVPIFSLPQEWLWCETWCSDETKAASKTIDLCNNPLHKEPKVSMAKRIISGQLFNESWIELDAEVEMYEKQYLETVNQ